MRTDEIYQLGGQWTFTFTANEFTWILPWLQAVKYSTRRAF
jgi:hypothetical protein